MNLRIGVATMDPKGGELALVQGWLKKAKNRHLDYMIRYNTSDENWGVLKSYQWLYENIGGDIICYTHDDVRMDEEGWDARIIREFEDPTVGVVGFGGAKNHGHADIYKTPYRLQQLARANYLGNADDAEVHGDRFTGATDVAVLDGYVLCVRRSLLDRCGGWPVTRYPSHHVYDYFLCCMAHSLGYRVRCVGVRAHHHGGRTAVTKAYHDWCKTTRWGSDSAMHEAGHRLIYDDFRASGVLPWRCR